MLLSNSTSLTRASLLLVMTLLVLERKGKTRSKPTRRGHLFFLSTWNINSFGAFGLETYGVISSHNTEFNVLQEDIMNSNG